MGANLIKSMCASTALSGQSGGAILSSVSGKTTAMPIIFFDGFKDARQEEKEKKAFEFAENAIKAHSEGRQEDQLYWAKRARSAKA